MGSFQRMKENLQKTPDENLDFSEMYIFGKFDTFCKRLNKVRTDCYFQVEPASVDLLVFIYCRSLSYWTPQKFFQSSQSQRLKGLMLFPTNFSRQLPIQRRNLTMCQIIGNWNEIIIVDHNARAQLICYHSFSPFSMCL